MGKLFLDDLRSNWGKIGHYKTPRDYELELKLYKKLLSFFQVGEYYYFVFIPPEARIGFVSDSIIRVLGYDPDEFTIEKMVESIHPDDLPYFTDFEATVVEFKMSLPPNKIMKYKSRYNYRLRKKSGDYLHILQQSMTVQTDDQGSALRNLVIHTDISEFKTDNSKSLSFIGMEGEPSFLNYEPKKRFIPTKSVFTKREKEILSLLSQNYSSHEIAEMLFISPQTVATHRRNIHTKAGTGSVLELITKAMEMGWL